MRRYMSRPAKAEFYDDVRGIDYLTRVVLEPDAQPRPTGLLDAYGNPLFAVDEMEPIGFVRLKERT